MSAARLALAALATGAFAAALPATAAADERTCRGTLRAITVDDLRVPAGATCVLRGTRVEGNVKVGTRATLRAHTVRVDGNVQAEGARRVVVNLGSRVGGSVQLVQGGNGRVARTTVGGDIQIFENRGRFEIVRNRVDGNLQCKENRLRPVGSRNVVEGNKEDQCRRL